MNDGLALDTRRYRILTTVFFLVPIVQTLASPHSTQLSQKLLEDPLLLIASTVPYSITLTSFSTQRHRQLRPTFLRQTFL